MDAVVISNGPSASLYPGRGDANVVIGVNWSWIKHGFPVDWWCFCDFRTFAEYEPLGDPALFTKAVQVRKLNERLIGQPHGRLISALAAGRILHHEDIDVPALPVGLPPWNSYSGTAALLLARHLGARRIVVYGADMRGEFDGAGDRANSRTEKRWQQREWPIWRAIRATLADEGISLERRVEHAVATPSV